MRLPGILPYCLGTPARKQPTPQDAVTAHRILLDGLGQDADLSGLLSELAPLHPPNDTFLFAAIAYIRAAAARAGVPVSQACRQLTENPAARPS